MELVSQSETRVIHRTSLNCTGKQTTNYKNEIGWNIQGPRSKCLSGEVQDCLILYNSLSLPSLSLLDEIYGGVAARRLGPPLGVLVRDGTVPAAGLQEVGTEYLHPVMSPPLGSPVGEPDLG